MELAIHDLKIGIEKRNVKQSNYMTQLERDMEDVLTEVAANGSYSKGNTLSRNNDYNGFISDSAGFAKQHHTTTAGGGAEEP